MNQFETPIPVVIHNSDKSRPLLLVSIAGSMFHRLHHDHKPAEWFDGPGCFAPMTDQTRIGELESIFQKHLLTIKTENVK